MLNVSGLTAWGRRLWPLLIVIVPCVALALGGDALRDALQYDRQAVLSGAWWRLLTGNFVHLGWSHLSEDMVGYLLLWLLFEDVLPGWRAPVLVLAGACGTGLGLLAWDPTLRWYVGISGALNTLWLVGALCLIKRRERTGWVLGLFLLAKLVYEQLWGPLPFSEATTGGRVAVDAHLYGALTGLLIALGILLKHQIHRRRSV